MQKWAGHPSIFIREAGDSVSEQAVAYMVQGFFFQEQMQLGIAMKPIEGAVAVINRAMVRDMFAGIVGQGEFTDEWGGSLVDAFGTAVMSDVEVGETEFRFDKRYEGRSDSIHYEFRLNGDLWVGEYSGDYVGQGYANCILTPIPERMFGMP